MPERVLVLTSRVPFPPDKGDRLRTFHLLRSLAGRFTVDLACLARGGAERRAAQALRPLCRDLVLASGRGRLGLARGALSWLRGRSLTEGFLASHRLRRELLARPPYDLLVAVGVGMIPLARSVAAKARALDLVDVDSAKWAAYAGKASPPRAWALRREAGRVAALERLALVEFDAVFLSTERERRRLSAESGGERIVVVPNGVDSEYFAPRLVEDGPARLVFTGTMSYPPNIEAVEWFARAIWPVLSHDFPDLHFDIVGRNPGRAVRRLGGLPGITVTGAVDDVRPYLARASAAVVPLRQVHGVPNKVLEAMAMGRAVVASPAALEAFEVVSGVEAVAAEAPDVWRRELGRLLTQPERRASLEHAARRAALERYTWSVRLAPFLDVCLPLSRGLRLLER